MIRRGFYPLFFVLLFSIFSISQSQGQELMYEDDTPILLRNDLQVGLEMHTRGWGVNVRRGYHKTGLSKRIYEVHLASMKHPKEVKTKTNEDQPPYVYGKLNNVTILRLGAGIQKVLFSRGDRTGLEIRLAGITGFSLALLSPVYLKIKKIQTNGEPGDPVNERYNPEVHNQSNIYGRANNDNPLSDLGFRPGCYGKLGLNFDFAKSDRAISAIEIGGLLDAYFATVPIMAYSRNNSYFFSLYMQFSFGGKW